MRIVLALYLLFSAVLHAQEAPDFQIGEDKSLNDLQGQVVYLDFWASWCKPCRKSFPWLNQMQAKYADKGLRIYAVNLDTEAELASDFLKRVPADFPIIYDPKAKIAQSYQLLGMPSSYLIDASGQIRVAHKGFFLNKQDAYEQEIVALLNEMEKAK